MITDMGRILENVESKEHGMWWEWTRKEKLDLLSNKYKTKDENMTRRPTILYQVFVWLMVVY